MLFVVHLRGRAGNLERISHAFTGLNQRREVFREAGPAEPRPGVQKFVADPVVESHAFGDQLDVCAHLLAHRRDFVDKRNFDGEKSVGGIFDHLSGRNVRDHNRGLEQIQGTIEVFHNRDGLFAVCTDDDPVRSHKVFDGGAFPQEFRIGHNIEAEPAGLIGLNHFAQLFAGPDRHRGLGHDDLISGHILCNPASHFFHIR